MGRAYPPLPAGCPVRFENLSLPEANGRYEQIGLVSLTGTSDEPPMWMGETKDKLWPKVCDVAGTIVTPNASAGGASVMGMGTGIIQFAVWRERDTTPTPSGK